MALCLCILAHSEKPSTNPWSQPQIIIMSECIVCTHFVFRCFPRSMSMRAFPATALAAHVSNMCYWTCHQYPSKHCSKSPAPDVMELAKVPVGSAILHRRARALGRRAAGRATHPGVREQFWRFAARGSPRQSMTRDPSRWSV